MRHIEQKICASFCWKNTRCFCIAKARNIFQQKNPTPPPPPPPQKLAYLILYVLENFTTSNLWITTLVRQDLRRTVILGCHIYWQCKIYLSIHSFLAHLSHRLMVSYCHQPMSGVRRQSSVVRRPSSTIASNDISSETAKPRALIFGM